MGEARECRAPARTEVWAKPASVQITRQNRGLGKARECTDHTPERRFGRSPRVQSARQNGGLGKARRNEWAKALQDMIDFLPYRRYKKTRSSRKRTMTETECKDADTDTATRSIGHECQKMPPKTARCPGEKRSHVGHQSYRRKNRMSVVAMFEQRRPELNLHDVRNCQCWDGSGDWDGSSSGSSHRNHEPKA